MLNEPLHPRYLRFTFVWIGAFVLLLLVSGALTAWLEPEGPLRIVLGALPAIPVVIGAFLDGHVYLQTLDELQQKIYLQAMSAGVAAMGAFCISASALEDLADFQRLPAYAALIAFVIGSTFGWVGAQRRYA